jgi:hypothetical protein
LRIQFYEKAAASKQAGGFENSFHVTVFNEQKLCNKTLNEISQDNGAVKND